MKRIGKCLLRPNAPCGRNLSAVKGLCFIAVPSSEEFFPDLEAIIRVLAAEGISGYVAVQDQQPGIEIFCEKICSKIIDAELCVVVLNDVFDESSRKRFPNANVYFEYGLMVGLGKAIVPMQRSEFKLPFDVNHVEVIKYCRTNLADKLAPVMAKLNISGQPGAPSRKTLRTSRLRLSPFASRLSRALELEGFRPVTPAKLRLTPAEDIRYGLYHSSSGELAYATVCESGDTLDTLLINTRLLLHRIEDSCCFMQRAIGEFKRKSYTSLLREWEDTLMPLGRLRIVVGLSEGDTTKVLQELKSVLLNCKMSFPLPSVEVWDQGRIEQIERLPTGR